MSTKRVKKLTGHLTGKLVVSSRLNETDTRIRRISEILLPLCCVSQCSDSRGVGQFSLWADVLRSSKKKNTKIRKKKKIKKTASTRSVLLVPYVRDAYTWSWISAGRRRWLVTMLDAMRCDGIRW